jgi:hypothetical protein
MPTELKQVDGGAVVDPVIGGLAGIGQPTLAAGGLQAQVMTDHTFPGGAGGDALSQGGCADSDFHGVTSSSSSKHGLSSSVTITVCPGSARFNPSTSGSNLWASSTSWC